MTYISEQRYTQKSLLIKWLLLLQNVFHHVCIELKSLDNKKAHVVCSRAVHILHNQLTELRSTLIFVTHENMYCKIIWHYCFHFAWKMKIMTSDAIFFPISSKFRRITQCGLHTSKCISDILQIVEKLPEKSWNVCLNMCTISHIFLHSK